MREGSLDAPTRHPLAWRDPEFYDKGAQRRARARLRHLPHLSSLRQSVRRVSDPVRPDRREQDRRTRQRRQGGFRQGRRPVYLCDVCFMTKCPYVPPHPWNVDFPHLMLRAKAQKFERGEVSVRDRVLTSTDKMGKLATIPVVVQMVNAASAPPLRKLGEKMMGIAAAAKLPPTRATVPAARRAIARVARPCRRAHAGQGRGLRDVLRQLQRAGHRPRSAEAPCA